MPTQKDIKAGWVKINGTVYNLVKMIDGSTEKVIWPTSQTYRYVIDSATLVMHYPSGANWLPATGGSANYCYATANVKKMQGETVVETISGATLRAAGVSGTYASHFTISVSGIYGDNLHTTEVNTGTSQSPQGYYCTASWVYVPQEGDTSEAVTNTIYQQYNIVESYVVTGTDVYCSANPGNLPRLGGDSVITGEINRDIVNTWTTGETSVGVNHDGYLYVYVGNIQTPAATISHGGQFTLTAPENTTDDEITYRVTVKLTTDQSISAYVDVIQATYVYTYGNITIYSSFSDAPANGDSQDCEGYALQERFRDGVQISDLHIDNEDITWSPASFSGNNLGTTQTQRRQLATVITGSCSKNGHSASDTFNCYQEANVRTYVGTDTGTTIYGTPVYQYSQEKNPSVSISANNYTSSGSSCPAGGGSTGFSYSGSVQRRDLYNIPWSRTDTIHYVWTSGAPETESDPHSGYDSEWTQWASTSVTPTISGGDTWLDHDDEEVTISSRGTTTGSARSATYTASYTALNGVTASDSVTLYQEANSRWEIIEHYRDIEITTTGTIPAAGGFFNLRYKAYYDHGSYEYTSGATSGTSQRDPDSATINLFNCSYNGDSEIQVNGSIAWAAISSVYVGPNSSSSTVTASVDIDGEESDSITQDAASVTYTLELYSGAIHVTDGYEFDWSGQQHIISTLTLVDNGTNLHRYSFDKMPGSVADIGLNLRTGDIEVSGITRGMDDWFTVSEASSGESVTFWIKTNAL